MKRDTRVGWTSSCGLTGANQNPRESSNPISGSSSPIRAIALCSISATRRVTSPVAVPNESSSCLIRSISSTDRSNLLKNRPSLLWAHDTLVLSAADRSFRSCRKGSRPACSRGSSDRCFPPAYGPAAPNLSQKREENLSVSSLRRSSSAPLSPLRLRVIFSLCCFLVAPVEGSEDRRYNPSGAPHPARPEVLLGF